jgi:hypothetical protein
VQQEMLHDDTAKTTDAALVWHSSFRLSSLTQDNMLQRVNVIDVVSVRNEIRVRHTAQALADESDDDVNIIGQAELKHQFRSR